MRCPEPALDRAQVDDLSHVPPAAFDIEQLLVAACDVRDGGWEPLARSRYLPSGLVSVLAAVA